MQPQGPRFLHVPQTEQEVVCLFVTLLDDLDQLDKPLIIERVETGFPDCTVRAGGKQIRIEFELYGGNFDHPFGGCDMVVCWRDNRNDWPDDVRVVELAQVVEDKKQFGLFVNRHEGYPAPWSDDSFFAAAERDGTAQQDIALARRIIDLARERKWGPLWLVNPKPVFAVGRPQFFKVDSRGRIGFPFSRLRAGDAFSELADRLNRVIPSLRLQAGDDSTKSKGGQLSDVLQSDQQVLDFFEVWSWFSSIHKT